jgi:hypothetical protein
MLSKRVYFGSDGRKADVVRMFQRVCFATGTAALLAAMVMILRVLPQMTGHISAYLLPLVIGAALYLLGHCLRVARLALLLADSRIGLRNLTAFHFWASATALLIPFKAGDLVRAAALSSLTGSLRSGVAFVWMERLFDATILIPLLAVVTISTPEVLPGFLGLLIGTGAFVLLSMAILVLAPDNLRRIGTLVFQRYNGANSVAVLRMLKAARVYLLQISEQLTGRTLLLLTYTLFIWVFELAAAWLIMASLAHGGDPLIALLSFFSSLVEGDSLPAMLIDYHKGGGRAADLPYIVVTQFPLLLCGIAAGFLLLKGRIPAASRRWART